MKKKTFTGITDRQSKLFHDLLRKIFSMLTTLTLAAVSMNSYADWKKPTKEEIKKKLTSLQYKVTQQEGTEKPFDNEYWNNHKEGLYVDIVSGEPLFLSSDKFDSGTGWPSFTKPISKESVVEKIDRGFFMTRTEIRSKIADSHLGHVFPDGPKPTGLRYCMNSAAMRFIPKENLVSEGYAKFISYFDPQSAENSTDKAGPDKSTQKREADSKPSAAGDKNLGPAGQDAVSKDELKKK